MGDTQDGNGTHERKPGHRRSAPRVETSHQYVHSRAYADQQNAVQRDLTRFINGGFDSRMRALAAAAGIKQAWRAEARTVRGSFRRLAGMRPPETAPPESISIEPYSGRRPEISALRDDVAGALEHDLVLCLVHGSVATGEAISYSDVDALIVLKDEVAASPERLARAGRLLSRARGRMYAFDALQHHGWFVLTEQDLRCHCEAYFPKVLFRYAKLLIPDRPIGIQVAVRDSRAEMVEAFRHLSDLVRTRLKSGRPPTDLYELKTLLSQFMLLPTLYLQVRDGAGIWKGRSFALAAEDFTAGSWRSMETASAIRSKWPQLGGVWLPRLHGPVAQKLAKHFAPEIPTAVDASLTGEFYGSALALVDEMISKIDEVCVRNRDGALRDDDAR